MSTYTQLDRALKANGWRYDRGDEIFLDGAGKPLHYQKVLRPVPGMSLDAMASDQDYNYDHPPKRRTAKTAAKKVAREKAT